MQISYENLCVLFMKSKRLKASAALTHLAQNACRNITGPMMEDGSQKVFRYELIIPSPNFPMSFCDEFLIRTFLSRRSTLRRKVFSFCNSFTYITNPQQRCTFFHVSSQTLDSGTKKRLTRLLFIVLRRRNRWRRERRRGRDYDIIKKNFTINFNFS